MSDLIVWRMNHQWVILISMLILISCSKSNNEDIPFTSKLSIEVDGTFEADEWKRAKLIEIASDHYLYLAQDNDDLFLGIKTDENVSRYVDLYFYNEVTGMTNLHASMQLGERQLTDDWDDSNPSWNWGNNISWSANSVEVISEAEDIPFSESVKPYQGFEFRISKKKLNSKHYRIRIEIKDFIGQASDIIFPENSERKITENWIALKLNSGLTLPLFLH